MYLSTTIKKKSYQPAGVIVVKFDESLDVAALPVRRVEEGSGLAVAEVDVVAAAAPLPLAVQGCVGGTQGPCNIPRHCHTSHGADYLEGKCGSSQDRGERDGSVGRWSRTASKQFRCSTEVVVSCSVIVMVTNVLRVLKRN